MSHLEPKLVPSLGVSERSVDVYLIAGTKNHFAEEAEQPPGRESNETASQAGKKP